MKTTIKRAAAALLSAALLLGLTACGEKREVHKVNWVTAPAYEAEETALPVQAGDLLGCCTDGTYMYIRVDTKEGEEEKSHLLRVSLADGEAAELDGYEDSVVPDGGFKNTLGPVLAPDGTMWLYEMWSIAYYDLPEDFDPKKENRGQYLASREDFHHLRQLDPATGRQKKLTDLSDAVRTLDVSDAFDIAGFAVDGKGNIYFAGTGGVAVMDGKGKYLFTLEASLPNASFEGTSGGPLALLPDGSVAALTIQPGGKRAVRSIDVSAKGWGAERYELPSGVDLLYGGTNGFLFYYTSGGILWAWEPEGSEGRMLLNWPAVDVPGSRMCFAPLEEGKLAVLSRTRNGTITDEDYWYHTDIRLSMLSPVDRLPREQRVKLVYGTIGTDSVLRYRIDQFNKENTEYYIELRNYAGENVERIDLFRNAEARDAALTRLNAEVASGQLPDIWDTSLPIALYARKGVLEDLWPYIDNDPEINREDLMSHVLDCASVDGKLYQIFNVFDIDTAAAPSEVVGNRTGWTLDEMMEYYEAMPEGSSLMGYSYSKIDLLYNLLYFNLNTWINWSTGECRFDTESFKSLLSLCERLGTDGGEYDAELWSNEDNGVYLREGRQLFEIAHLSGPEDLLLYDSVMGGPRHITDYGTYLNENNIFSSFYDENGNKRSEEALYCLAMGFAWIKDGKYEGEYAITPDAVIGAVEGGGYADYIGMPSDRGSGSSFLLPVWHAHVEGQWGISAACQAKDGAWAYIRQFLLPHGSGEIRIDDMTYVSTGFPINRADFDALFAPVWFQRKDGEYALDQDGRRIEEPRDVIGVNLYNRELETAMILYQLAPNELQMKRFWDLYNAIDNVSVGDSTIMNMIEEQAEVYFAGDKSLEETADLIQRRVTLYVNENR